MEPAGLAGWKETLPKRLRPHAEGVRGEAAERIVQMRAEIGAEKKRKPTKTTLVRDDPHQCRFKICAS